VACQRLANENIRSPVCYKSHFPQGWRPVYAAPKAENCVDLHGEEKADGGNGCRGRTLRPEESTGCRLYLSNAILRIKLRSREAEPTPLRQSGRPAGRRRSKFESCRNTLRTVCGHPGKPSGAFRDRPIGQQRLTGTGPCDRAAAREESAAGGPHREIYPRQKSLDGDGSARSRRNRRSECAPILDDLAKA